MPISRSLSAIAIAGATFASLISPAAATKPQTPSMDAPVLLTNPNITWVAGATGWINLSWTASSEMTDVRVSVVPTSKGFDVEYPGDNQTSSGLMDNADLSANEIDFTSFQATTTGANSGTKWADVTIEWTADGKRHSADAGRLKLSNKKYKGDDFAILTDSVTAVSGPDAFAKENWLEVGYLGLSPMNSNFSIEISADGLPIYHPQNPQSGSPFTSLHHDHVLNGGETDVARIFLDPDLIAPGNETLDVVISYTDLKGKSKSVSHKVALTIE